MDGADEAPALLLRSRTLTFRELRERIALLSGWLAKEVPEPGARVASWAGKSELTCLLPLAAARAGLVHVPVNPLLKPAQVAHILADSGAGMLIAPAARLASLEPSDVPAACRPIDEGDALAQAAELGVKLPPSAADPAELAAILYTSGSTGRPKGVMLSHANMWLGARSVAGYLGLQPQDRVLAVLPLSFDYGQNQLLSSWYAGACVVPLDYLTADDVLKAVARYDITTLAAVPPLWVQLAEADWPRDTAAKLRRLTNSGGALTPDLVRRLRGAFPQARLFAMYGLTEAFRSTFLDPDLIDSHPTSMGKAIPFAEILVIGDGGEVTADGEEGELVHCGPLVAQGYWRDAARTAERFRPAPPASRYGGPAVWSGDRVRRERDGLLYFVGRRDAMIKSSGNRISPQEIEEEALATGLVAEAVALGIADERLGQAVHLVVRPLPGAAAAETELPRLLAQRLPGFMQPRAVHWRDAMPTGPNGKIDRQRLAEECGRAAAPEPASPAGGTQGPGAPAGSSGFRAEMAGILGVKAIRDEDTFVSLGGDSMNYVHATILLDGTPAGIPEDWEHLPFARLEERLFGPAAAQAADSLPWVPNPSVGRRPKVLETSVFLRAIAIMLVVLNHTINGKVSDVFAGATSVLLLLVGVNFARFQLPQLEAGISLKAMNGLARNAVLPYFALLTAYFVLLRHVFWPQYFLYSNFTEGFVWDGERRFKTYWFIEVYIEFVFLMCSFYLVPQVRAFSRKRPAVVPAAGFVFTTLMALAARPYLAAGTIYEHTLFSALPLVMFGWLAGIARSRRNKYLLLAAGGGLMIVLPMEGGALSVSSLVIAVPALMFLRRVAVPSYLARPLSIVAAASFHIYLLHSVALHAVRKLSGGAAWLPGWEIPLAFAASLGLGLMAWQVQEWVKTGRFRHAAAAKLLSGRLQQKIAQRGADGFDRERRFDPPARGAAEPGA